MYQNLVVFKRWLIEIMSADTFAFDLWEVNVHLHEDGQFFHVKQGKTMTLLDADGQRVVNFKKMCCNYFSTGLESRIGLGFERNRTKSQTLNKLAYGIEGIKAVLLLKQPRIREYVDELVCGADTLDGLDSQSPPEPQPSPPGAGHETSSVDDGSGGGTGGGSGGQWASFYPPIEFKHNPVSLIFENIPSMASGCDFWGGAYKHAIKKSVKGKLSPHLLGKAQEIGDGKVEVMTIKALAMYTLAQMGLPRGVAKRVAQSAGPFEVRFNQDYRDRVYFQIDGENYACLGPRNATVHHARQYQVLVRRNCKLSLQGGLSKTGVSPMDFTDLLETGQYGAREWQYGSERQTPAPASPSSDGGDWDADWDDGRDLDAQLIEAAEAWGLLHDVAPLGSRPAPPPPPSPPSQYDHESDSDSDTDSDEVEAAGAAASHGNGSSGTVPLSPLTTTSPHPPRAPPPPGNGMVATAPATPTPPAPAATAAAAAEAATTTPATPSTASKSKVDYIPEPSGRSRGGSNADGPPPNLDALVALSALTPAAAPAPPPPSTSATSSPPQASLVTPTRKKSWPEEDRRAKEYLADGRPPAASNTTASASSNGHAVGHGDGDGPEPLHANVHPAMPPAGFFFPASPDPDAEARRLGFVDVLTPAAPATSRRA
jgi:diacylglycerol kinase (ATP)